MSARTPGKPTIKEIAEHLEMSTSNWINFRKRLDLPERPTLDEARKAYILNLRATAANKGLNGENQSDLAGLKVQFEKAKLEKIEMHNQRYKGELLDANEVEQYWNQTLMAFRTRMLAIPSHLSPTLAACKDFGEIQATLKIAMDDVLQDLSEFDIDQYTKELDEPSESDLEVDDETTTT